MLSWSHPFVLVTGRAPGIITPVHRLRLQRDGSLGPPASGVPRDGIGGGGSLGSVSHYRVCRPVAK
jgi:hypothetical protein